MGSPHNLDAVRAAMDVAQAVVVIFTAEDQAGVLPDLAEDDAEVMLRGQPRQNVLLEAGLAMGVDRARTILVELGPIRHATDVEGLNVVRLTNSATTRAALRSRLANAGCAVADAGGGWMTAEAGGDFEDCLVRWEAQLPIAVQEAERPMDEHSRKLHAAIQKVIGELDYNLKLLVKAAGDERYWNPERRTLVSGEWHREYELLAGERRLQSVYRIVESAHHEIDRINHLVDEKHRMLPDEDLPIPVQAEDHLGKSVEEVEQAISALQALLSDL
jgi:hypothetical protein